jgi:hypothetical protein
MTFLSLSAFPSLDAVTITTTLRKVTPYIGVWMSDGDDLWTYLEYQILMSSDATIFSAIALMMGTGLVFWICKSSR